MVDSSPSHSVIQAQQARSSYNRLSRWYDLFSSSEWPLTVRAITLLAVRPGEKGLEIGCGTGHGVEALGRLIGAGGAVIGLDISEGMLAQGRRRVRSSSLSFSPAWIMGDAVHLPLRSASLDTILLSFTLELFDPLLIPSVLQQCRRVLRPGGRLGVACMARREPQPWMGRLYGWAQRTYPTLIDCRPIDVQDYLLAAGFEAACIEESSLWGLPVAVALGRKLENE